MKNSLVSALIFVTTTVLAGCGGGGDNTVATVHAATPAPIVVQNTAPHANLVLAGQLTAGTGTADGATFTQAEVKFDASASTDAESDPLTFTWILTSKPIGSAVTIKGNGSLVTVTPDVAGTYAVSVRITDSKGAFVDKQASVGVVANAAPVAAVDASRLSTVVGTVVNLNAGYSSDGDGDKLTYSWALDTRPVGSAVTINSAEAKLAFTPDVAGEYVASITVSDGKVSNVAHVTMFALATSNATTLLPFKPLVSRYSKGLDLFVTTSGGPDLLSIVDPFTSTLRQVSLPATVKDMTLSPDGKLAVVLHEGAISVVDVENAVLLRSSSTGSVQTVAFITNVGMVYLMGQPNNSNNGQLVSVINGRTGADMTSTLSAGFGGTSTFPSAVGGVYSGIRHRAYVSRTDIQTEIVSFSINSENVASVPISSGYRKSYSPLEFFLNQSEDILFARNGNFFRADTLEYVGQLILDTHIIGSLSQSNAADETLVLMYGVIRNPATNSYPPLYQSSYHRFTGVKYDVAADIDFPIVGDMQSYGIGIYHSVNSYRIALVQAGSDISYDTGLRYYLIAR